MYRCTDFATIYIGDSTTYTSNATCMITTVTAHGFKTKMEHTFSQNM